jgi:hypothetical protein
VIDQVDALLRGYRESVVATVEEPVRAHYPALLDAPDDEYRKMLELSTKMTLVGHACCEIAGYPYDERRRTIGSLYGVCCFLADSFIDDFGPDATREYLQRIEVMLKTGWFDVRTAREQLFYAIVSRLFAERDVLDPILRQAILLLFEAPAARRGDAAGRRRRAPPAPQAALPPQADRARSQRSRDHRPDRVRRARDRALDPPVPPSPRAR